MSSILSLLCFAAISLVSVVGATESSFGPRHLVVLSHGLHGCRHDLTYLAEKLEEKGCLVLKSSGNEYLESHNGIEEGAKRLAGEVRAVTTLHPTLQDISFVGNSLGGLYSRYAVRELYDVESGLISGLNPFKFMTIASPHLGVRNYTLFEEYSINIPTKGKEMLANAVGATGRDLYGHDPNYFRQESIVYRMATEEQFLRPLKAFKKRRLYANLHKDLMVPLGTAAFMDSEQVATLRKEHGHETGIVRTVLSEQIINNSSSVCNPSELEVQGHSQQCSVNVELEQPVVAMRAALDALGWEKVIVSFKGVFGFFPMAHNQIAAVTKFGTVIDGLLGFHEGRHVMRDAAEWITSALNDETVDVVAQ